ncbi:centromere protein X isoform X1 [Varanus komodoensis]|uniref:centromere protein X isoform X1 n=1 Tax=Varanus komodoensis TaxID=61221 RepID=UPI001CF7D4D2|nr:centromere protein X isoform X1 [Varanus komodoensis]
MEKREQGARSFKKETVNKLLQFHFKDDKTRVSGDAVLLVAEMLKVFVRVFICLAETAARGARQAQTEDLTRVDVEHVEKVLPQVLLDF